MFNVFQPQRSQIFQHLIFKLIAINQQNHCRLASLGGLKQQLGRLDHRVSLAAALSVPHQATGLFEVQ